MSWIEQEPGVADTLREASRLARRALRRPLLVCVCALVSAAAAVWVALRFPREAEAEVVLQVKEGLLGANGTPRSTGELRAYVNDVALSMGALLDVARSQKLTSAARLARAPDGVVDDLRLLITVDIWYNEFLSLRAREGANRTALISVRVRFPTYPKALGVARALAQHIVDAQTSQQDQRIAFERSEARSALDRVAQEVAELRERWSQDRDQVRAADDAAWETDLSGTKGRLSAAGVLQGNVDLAEHGQAEDMVLRTEIVDPGRDKPPPPAGRWNLVAAVLGLMVVALVAGAVFVAAFDPVAHLPEDIARLGVPVIGRLSRLGEPPDNAARQARPNLDLAPPVDGASP